MKRKIKLTPYEKRLVEEKLRGEWVPASKERQEEMAAIIKAHNKGAVLNMRINKNDLDSIKKKAKKLGVKYQTFISQILHRVAQDET